jgi:hypothetical protein
LGESALLCPVEEMLWSKAFIMERERFDGADIAHLLRARAADLDWDRLVRRFGDNWRVLFAHLVLFGYIYPPERDRIPTAVIEMMTARLLRESHTVPPVDPICQGTNLSREQYLVDVDDWGYEDARLAPEGPMSSADVERWTAGITVDGADTKN